MDQHAVATVQGGLQKVSRGSGHVDGVMTEVQAGLLEIRALTMEMASPLEPGPFLGWFAHLIFH